MRGFLAAALPGGWTEADLRLRRGGDGLLAGSETGHGGDVVRCLLQPEKIRAPGTLDSRTNAFVKDLRRFVGLSRATWDRGPCTCLGHTAVNRLTCVVDSVPS